MYKNIVRLLLLITIIGLIVCITYVLNIWFPLNFSFYFIICTCSILLNAFFGKKFKNRSNTTIIPWIITTIASFLVTINYLSPRNPKVYSNADVNVLALRGVDMKDSLVLIGNDKLKSLYDDPQNEGVLTVVPSDSSLCKVVYNIVDQPLYLSSPSRKRDSLLNANLLPSFNNTLKIGDSLSCTISFNEVNETKWFVIKKDFPFFIFREKNDSMLVSVCFRKEKNESIYLSDFRNRINDSYNLYDVIHKNVSFTPEEEELISSLRNITIIRNKEYEKSNSKSKKFFVTYKNCLDTITMFCDGTEFKPTRLINEYRLAPNEYIYTGQYTTNTHPLTFKVSENGNIEARYKFPYLYNFPRTSIEEGFRDGQRKILAISSSSESLLQSDVDEAFYCDIFSNDKNIFCFGGSINYKVSSCNEPFIASIIDNQNRDNANGKTLLAKNGALWQLDIYDLRVSSPITGSNTPFTNRTFIIALIAICCIFAYLSTHLGFKNRERKLVIFSIWLFLIPFIVFRLYLLWRIAVFPPVTDITYSVFQRYRMENIWSDNAMINTLIAIGGLMFFTLLSSFYEQKNILTTLWGNKHVCKSFTRFKVLYCVLWGISVLLSIASSGVFANIFAPVVSFAVCEYISLKGLNYKWRSANVFLAVALLCMGDPGYAIMFIIFSCVYFIIHLYSYMKSDTGQKINSNKAIAFLIFLILFIIVVPIIFSAQIISIAYDDSTRILSLLTPSKLFFGSIGVFFGIILFLFFWFKTSKKKATIAICLIPIYVFLFYILGNYVLEHERHFKYRSLVHTEQVSEIMEHEDVDDRNSVRVLEASQNQWFIQYHNNRGSNRIFEDGIFSLSPHFKKGVTWNTQISDVIISRYVVGELSSVLPCTIVILAICFFISLIKIENASFAGRSMAYAIALLLLIQITFVWMAATNRMIFFGQDFPFLSQNARITMFMFVILIGFVMLSSNTWINEKERSSYLEKGLKNFSEKRIPIFVIVFLLTFAFVGAFGNKYSSLYGEEDGGDSNNASEYNLSRMMNRCQSDLSLINNRLADSKIKVRTLKDGESLAILMDSLDNENGAGSLTRYVEELYENKEISKFTLSMYNAYRNNLKRRNSITNIIHLKLSSSQSHYEFALNNGFYTLRNPEFDALAWDNNIYSDNVRNTSDITLKEERNGYVIYSIPISWLPKGNEIGIIDATNVNSKTINQSRTLHSELADYLVNIPICPIKSGDILEVTSNDKQKTESYKYGISQEDILVKNMIINGKRKFFYPLKEKCFWLRSFSDLVSYCYTNKEDSVIITLDKELVTNVYNALAETKKKCSVVAMDGLGNVRVMADHKDDYRYAIDPNDEEKIYETIKYTYLNPMASENNNFFGNMNLCYLNPGPGSSLKPITYAAVTSQSLDFPWEKLMLMSPSPQYYNNDSIQLDKKYSYLYKYGPSYIYKNPFKSIYTDENGNLGNGEQQWINSIFYLAKSSNYYNALVTYLGFFEGLDENLGSSTIFRPAQTGDYPKITVDNGNTVYTFRKTPEEDNAHNNLLLNGLWNNFSITTYDSYPDSLRDYFIGDKFSKVSRNPNKKLISIFPWVFPNESYVYEYRLDEKEPSGKLKLYTLGSDPLQITPMKMAEMYGKLYSLRPDYHATIIPNDIPFTEKWRGASGDNVSQESIFSFYKKNLFAGMYECVKRGTARDFFLGLPDNYSYYAKTGTLSGINPKTKKPYPEDRMLAVVITDKPIESVSSPSELKLYVIYFRYEKSDVFKDVGKILKIIMSSQSFKNYMH